MTDKTMPEKIYALQQRTWMEGSSRGGVEYIRADLVPAQSSADDTLEDGQWQWVKVYAADKWIAAEVRKSVFTGKLRLRIEGAVYDQNMLAVIGPAIQPPPA